MNVLTTEHKNLGSKPTKNDRAVTVTNHVIATQKLDGGLKLIIA